MRRLFYYFYLLQLENYDIGRFARATMRAMFRIPREVRKKFVWTFKMRMVAFSSALLVALAGIGAWYADAGLPIAMHVASETGFAVAAYYLYFLFCAAAVGLLLPFDWMVKTLYVWRARTKLAHMPRVKVVAITGSYGKTTMKELLGTVLQEKYRVVRTKENLNTQLGLARCILHDVKDDTDILIAEMGAYRKGDIRALCRIASPDIGILTGINESHLERFGTMENTVSAKFEIARFSKPTATVVLNADNELIRANSAHHVGARSVLWYGAHQTATERVVNSSFSPETLTTQCVIKNRSGKEETFRVASCAPYISSTVAGCVAVARLLALSEAQIASGIAMVKPVPHRLQPMRVPSGALIIDDSYNGNPEGARQAMRFLSQWKQGRRIYVTPGLVELGHKMQEIHQALGRELARSADIVVLIQSPGAFGLREGLRQEKFPEENLHWFATAQEAHRTVQKMLGQGDCALFQNDLPENYL